MTLPRIHSSVISRLLTAILTLLVLMSSGSAESTSYFILNPATALGGSPTSLLMQSSYMDVPAGAVLSMHLMKDHQIVSTSRLEFTTAYKSASVFPTQIVSFLASGSATVPGEPITGAKLYSGILDLTPIAASPKQYQFLWSLSDGVIATPGQAIITGGTQTVSFVDLRGMVSAASRQSDQKPGSVLFYHRYLFYHFYHFCHFCYYCCRHFDFITIIIYYYYYFNFSYYYY